MNSLQNNNLETFITYSKIDLPTIQSQEKQASSQSSSSLVFLHPSNGQIITESLYKSLTKTEDNKNSISKRKYQSSDSTKTKDVLPIKKPSFPKAKKNESNNKLFSNWSIEKLTEEIAKTQSEIDKITKEAVSEEEIEQYIALSSKWKKISQEAVYSLLELFPRDENYKSNTIGSVIKTFNINADLIDYDEENDCFND